tara:strand:+ start:62 stop:475 length:414 start_codon:yes stop_codon:yes gene_type:complete
MTTINEKTGDFVSLINGLYAVQDLPGKAFGLVVSKNTVILQDALKELENLGKPDPAFMELATKVNEIAKEESEDSKERIKKLEEEHAELVQGRRDQISITQSAMAEDMSLDLHLLQETDLPEIITAKHLTTLRLILE